MLPSLESLRCFAAVAEALNFRAAARAVGLTPAALSQRIRQLEDEMGVEPIFHRTTRSVALTTAGLALVPQAQRCLAAAGDCVRAARGELGPVPQDVILGTRHELGMSWLVPLLDDLGRAHPSVSFHVYFGAGDDLLLRLRTREVDCAVTSTRFTDPKLDATQLHREDYVFVGSRALLARVPLTAPEHGPAHTLIDAGAELPLFRYWREAPGGGDRLSFGRVLRVGTIAAIEKMVVAGRGVAVLPRYLVAPRLDAGDLDVVLPEVVPVADHFRLVYRAEDPRRALYHALAVTMLAAPLK